MINNPPDLADFDFGTVGHDREIHVVDGLWHGPTGYQLGATPGVVSLCGLILHRQIKVIAGKERRVCQDCTERAFA